MHNPFSTITRRFRRNSKGQSATEYMLIVAVVVLGLVAAASKLIPQFKSGVQKLGENVVETLEQNQSYSRP